MYILGINSRVGRILCYGHNHMGSNPIHAS